MSQQELADTAEISKLTIQRTENAKYSVKLDTLVSLADALNRNWWIFNFLTAKQTQALLELEVF